MSDLLTQLRLPFHPSQVEWKPGATNKDKTRCIAMAYADLRAYQNRLDEVCGLDWAVTYTPWGDRIVCHLTIQGVTRSSVGEADAQSEKSEIAGTAAEAQAFQCMMDRLPLRVEDAGLQGDEHARFHASGLSELRLAALCREGGSGASFTEYLPLFGLRWHAGACVPVNVGELELGCWHRRNDVHLAVRMGTGIFPLVRPQRQDPARALHILHPGHHLRLQNSRLRTGAEPR